MDTSEVVADILEHHGVLGMKWGVRTGGASGSRPSRAERKIAKRQAKFDKSFSNPKTIGKVKNDINRSIAPQMQHELMRMNAKPEYQKAAQEGKLDNLDNPVAKKYVNEYNKAFITHANIVLNQYQSPDGTKKLEASIDKSEPDLFTIKVVSKDVKHEDVFTFTVKYIRDDNGMITDFEIVPNDLTQSAIDDILEHHGVLGMKWGVRRDRSSSVTVSKPRIGKGIKTTGGYGHPAHADAVRTAKLGQVKRKSGIKALSNEELQAYTKRLNLEQNANRLDFETASFGRRQVMRTLRQTGNKTSDDVANAAGTAIGKKIIKGAATAAAAAA